MFMNLSLQIDDINVDNQRVNCNIFGPYGTPPYKSFFSKIGLRHGLSWPKLGLEPKYHDPWTSGGFGKRGQTDTQTH